MTLTTVAGDITQTPMQPITAPTLHEVGGVPDQADIDRLWTPGPYSGSNAAPAQPTIGPAGTLLVLAGVLALMGRRR